MRHQINGDYAQAVAAYQSLLDEKPSPAQAREASYGLAESLLLDRDYPAAAAAWEAFLATYPDDGRLPAAALMAARAYDAGGQCVQAIPHYEAYLAAENILADLVYEWIGNCLASLAATSPEPQETLRSALSAYRQALAATGDVGVQVGLREKIAGTYLALEDHEAAVAEYDAILNVARIDSYRAKIEYLAGQALAAAEQTEAAHQRYRRAVDQYPAAEYAYFALIALVNAGAEVDEFQRGLIDYYAGEAYPDAYGAAIEAFDRYLAAGPAAERADEALHYKALAQRALDQPRAALDTLDALIASYPESELLADAWIEKGITLAWMGDNDAAVKTYQDMAAFFPAHERAPKALWRAATLRQTEGAFAKAAALFEQLQASFPGFEDADEALWRAGLNHHQAGNRAKALANWRALLDKYPASPYRPKTLYWLGKLAAKPESADAPGYWEQLVAADPQGYYALRVSQIQAGQSLTSTRLNTSAVEAPAWDAAQSEAEIVTWLGEWTTVPTGTRLISLPPELARSRDIRRGQALLDTGLRREALEAFDGARAAGWNEPLALAQLTLYFHEEGLHGLAARCAYRLIGLWPSGAIQDAPLTLQRLAYPLVYADLLSAESQAQGLDPLLLAALVRQESLFEPAAESYAGARGLGQVMPATGEGIARNLNMDDFVLDDLYRPYVSIRFGAYYLAAQMKRFDDQILLALAAYNGGPGNTLRWLELGGDDLDLFVETITATQSRLYLQRVYEQYHTYEELYRSSDREGN